MSRFLLIACAVLPQVLFAQSSDSTRLPAMALASMYAHSGAFVTPAIYGSISDFRKLAPSSFILAREYKEYRSYNQNARESNDHFSFATGFFFRNKQGTGYRTDRMLRVGVSYLKSGPLYKRLVKDDRIRFDTLSSSQNNLFLYMDSVVSSTVRMDYEYEQLRLDLSYVFHFNKGSRWLFYGGAGITAGVGVSSVTTVDYRKQSYIELKAADGTLVNRSAGETLDAANEQFSSNTTFGASLNLVAGIDFRLSRRHEFWRNVSLFYEFRPGLNLTVIPELSSYTGISAFHCLGLKVYLTGGR